MTKSEGYVLTAHGEFLGKMIQSVRLAAEVDAQISRHMASGTLFTDPLIQRARERVNHYRGLAEMYGKACETLTSFQKMR